MVALLFLQSLAKYQFMWFPESQMHANRSEFHFVADHRGSVSASVFVGSTISSTRHLSETQSYLRLIPHLNLRELLKFASTVL